jgi:SAM-dependent methyltransferase
MKEEYRKNIYHIYNHTRNFNRINGFFGKIMSDQNKDIIDLIEGKKILDVGAGYGILTKTLQGLGYEAIGIEPNPEMVEYAKKRFSVELLRQSIYKTDFPNASFDTIILREVIAHLEFDRALIEINRIGKGLIIIFDTLPTIIVKCGRAIIGHREYNQKSLNYYIGLLRDKGYNICSMVFRDIIAFPLSGGFLGPLLVPRIEWVEKNIIMLDKKLNVLMKKIGLQKFFCWRFLVKAFR